LDEQLLKDEKGKVSAGRADKRRFADLGASSRDSSSELKRDLFSEFQWQTH